MPELYAFQIAHPILSIFISWLLFINMVGTAMMFLDKKEAQKGGPRAPERTLLIVALIGGSLGILVGMRQFHHKTRKAGFQLPLVLILAAQAALILGILRYIGQI